MRKYLTWRCIGLHVLVVVLVPAFLVAGWWQYHVALGGNDLSWVYTVEWPFFAVYAVYIWWKLVHDQSTPFDRLWAAKQRAAADAEGRPLHEIPGWATDRALAREVRRASRDAAHHELAGPRLDALDPGARMPGHLAPAAPGGAEDHDPAVGPSGPFRDGDLAARAGPVIDAEVLHVKAKDDEELDAYNRYLFELSRNGLRKQWSPRRRGRPDDVPAGRGTPKGALVRQKPALGPADEGT